MHVLITSDTVGGVWTYTQELVTGLARGGHQITLVSFGKLPLPHQVSWMQTLPGVDYRPTEYRLEWMDIAERDLDESRRYLELLVREVRPDVMHLSQYCYGDLDVDVPRVVVAHSDVVTWWVAVHGSEPENTPWMRSYRERVASGLQKANLVVAPSQWMLDAICSQYFHPAHTAVIYNGRTPELFDPDRHKEEFALSVGRVWDEGKHVALLLDRAQAFEVRVVGWEQEPGREKKAPPPSRSGVELLGAKSQAELHDLYAAAPVYVATSRYEPFGLSALEAALSRCALVMNDNPAFRELWGDHTIFFKRNDPDDLAGTLHELQQKPDLRAQCGSRCLEWARQRYTAARMVAGYEDVYHRIGSFARVA